MKRPPNRVESPSVACRSVALLASLSLGVAAGCDSAPPSGSNAPGADGQGVTDVTLVQLGACNPRVELCERPPRTVDADDAAEAAEAEEPPPDRGWLSNATCNPRVRRCHG